jgi:CRISPR-associated protein Cas1
MPADLHLLPKFRDRLSYLYVEHAVIERDSNSICFFDDGGKTQIPIATIALLMLGPGTKVSHSAMDVLARNNCLVAWCGEEGVRMYAFASGGTHSAARTLRQAEMVSDPRRRVATARQLYQMRFEDDVSDKSIEQLRGMEGNRVREGYRRWASHFQIAWEGRNYDRNQWLGADAANRALSAGTACLYGICHAAILSLGFSPALGFIHTGKQLSFVYDLADLYKMELVVPVAFEQAVDGIENVDRRVRQALRDRFRETRFLEAVSRDLTKIFGADDDDIEVYDEDSALPGYLIGDARGGVAYGRGEDHDGVDS